ncbi:MAG: ligand-gated channel [Akkermansiaceae bacterium]|nr:ligand-gated channel [Akkermansiaceae bacterium]
MKTFSISFITLFGTAIPLLAQSHDLLPEMVVNGTRKTQSLTSPDVATARAAIAKIAGGAEVVDAERYLRGRSSTVADTFALSPGVVAQSRFGSDEARLSIRGSGLQRTFHGRGLRVMQDGVPVNYADGSFDMQSLEPTAAIHVDVLRGANAMSYGSATLGGAIDYVSATGLNSPGASVRVEAGSHGYLRAGVSGGFSTGSADLYASFTEQTQQGFRQHADQDNQRFFANFGWRFNDDLETRLYLTAVRTDSELPGNLTKTQLETDPRQAALSNITGDQHRDYDLYRLASRTTYRNGDTTWHLTAGWTYKDLNHPIYQVLDYLSNDFYLGLDATHEMRLFGRPDEIKAGVAYSYGATDTSNYVNVRGHRGAKLSGADLTAINLDTFVENRLSLPENFHFITGASAAHSRRESERTFGNGANYASDFSNFAPRVGLTWEPDQQTTVYANVSGSYEAPSFSESTTVSGPNKAQTATTFELGTRGNRGPVRWDASIYRSNIDDELLTIVPDPSVPTATATINADKTLHQGVELGGEIDLLGQSWLTEADNRLVLRVAWTYGDFRFDNDLTYGDNHIAGLPPHLIRGELTWENKDGWYAGPTFEWVPEKSFIDHRNTYSADPYALVGFKFGQRREEGLSWFIEARNLTDERYAATTGVIENAGGRDSAQFLPGDGRSVYTGLQWRW